MSATKSAIADTGALKTEAIIDAIESATTSKTLEFYKSKVWEKHVLDTMNEMSFEAKVPDVNEFANPRITAIIMHMIAAEEPSRQRLLMKELISNSGQFQAHVNDGNKSDGITALHFACMVQNVLAVKFLLKIGKADTNKKMNLGFTPLHFAVGKYWMSDQEQNSLEIVEQLIKAGADVNSQTREGFTPLHEASRQGLKTAIKVLLKAGANPGICDESCICPVELAPDLETRKLLNKVVNTVPQYNECAYCDNKQDSDTPEGYATCSKCNSTAYCSKECQAAHWKSAHKKECIPYATAKPLRADTRGAAGKSRVRIDEVKAGQLGPNPAFLPPLYSKFIVKVMRPIHNKNDRKPLMIHTQDRSIMAYIYGNDQSYDTLDDRIKRYGMKEGYNQAVEAIMNARGIKNNNGKHIYDEGMKAFFWASRVSNREVRVFPAALAPEQLW